MVDCITVEQAIKEWNVENFTCTICKWCDYCISGEKEFKEHLLAEHEDEIKEFFEGVI